MFHLVITERSGGEVGVGGMEAGGGDTAGDLQRRTGEENVFSLIINTNTLYYTLSVK